MYHHNFTRKTTNEYTYVDGIGFAPCAPAITEKHIIKEYANGIGFILIVYLILSRLVPSILVKILSLMSSFFNIMSGRYIDVDLSLSFISVLSYIITITVPFLLYVMMYRIPRRVILPFSKVRPSDIALMVFMGLAVSTIGTYSSAAISVILSFFGFIPTHSDIYFDSNIIRSIVLFAQICIIAPVLEEIVFRGIIMQSLRRFGDKFALFMSALIFGLIHLNFIQSPSAFLMGLIIGYFVLRTNSLRVGIAMHCANNLMSLITSIIIDRTNIVYGGLFANIMLGIYLFAGIISFLLITKRYKNIFYLTKSRSICTNQTKVLWFLSSPSMVLAEIVMLFIMTNTLVFT